ncbi:MAG: NAD(P)-dependent alcohol dehydrogenase [Ignavibacteria bacterium]|nr:NAD(P)-dependent alcohol dehydrogenase [Ignavibacteria bacterium]
MKAVYIQKYGGPEVLEYGEIGDPVLIKKKVFIEVKAVSLNPLDYKIRAGQMKLLTGNRFPKILGGDFAGVVQEVDKQVSGFKPGDRVYGFINTVFRKPGAFADFITVEPSALHMIPEGMSFTEAASLPVAGLTALNAVRLSGDLHNKKILVTGASGGVGHFAIQIARHAGAEVTGVCSMANAPFAIELGAHTVLDYRTVDVFGGEMRYDVVFDAHGSARFNQVRPSLVEGGLFLSTLFMPGLILESFRQKIFGKYRLAAANMRGKAEDYTRIENLWLSKTVRPHIGLELPMSKAREAFTLLEKGGIRGKVILTN